MAEKVVPARHGNGFDPDFSKSVVARIESLEEEKRELSKEIAEVKKEAVDAGIPKQALVQTLNLRKLERKMGASAFRDHEDSVDLFRHAIGDLKDRPEVGEQDTAKDPE